MYWDAKSDQAVSLHSSYRGGLDHNIKTSMGITMQLLCKNHLNLANAMLQNALKNWEWTTLLLQRSNVGLSKALYHLHSVWTLPLCLLGGFTGARRENRTDTNTNTETIADWRLNYLSWHHCCLCVQEQRSTTWNVLRRKNSVGDTRSSAVTLLITRSLCQKTKQHCTICWCSCFCGWLANVS